MVSGSVVSKVATKVTSVSERVTKLFQWNDHQQIDGN